MKAVYCHNLIHCLEYVFPAIPILFDPLQFIKNILNTDDSKYAFLLEVLQSTLQSHPTAGRKSAEKDK